MERWTEALERDGYAVLPGLLTAAEVSVVQAGFERLEGLARTLGDATDLDGSRFVVQKSPFRLSRVVWCGGAEPALRLGAHPGFLAVAEGCLRRPDVVQLIQQAHFKLPGDGVDFQWHQDASNRRYGTTEWVDVDGRGAFVQVAVAVDPMTEDNGPLRVIPGSHRLGFVAHPTTGVLPAGVVDPDAAVTLTLAPGDAAVFGPFLVHGSGANRSDSPRRLFLQGFAAPGANRRVYPGCGIGVSRSAGPATG
ncbi:MAG: ectoine hydroxylase-related dioxygenase (phytanoyl-CoA dioxygenase family) [Myxococcota bacterium]